MLFPQELKDEKEKTSNELIKNLNELTVTLNHEREKIKKKDDAFLIMADNHKAELADLKNQLEESKKESFINLKDAEENKRKGDPGWLLKNLNEMTANLNHEKEECKKKDDKISTLTNNHNAEMDCLKNKLKALKKSVDSNELIKNLNEVTSKLNQEREENKKKDEIITNLSSKHKTEITELNNQQEALKKESSINLKDAEENKRKVTELEAKISDMIFQQNVADQDEMENIKKIQELKNQLTAEQAKNKTFSEKSSNLEALINENKKLSINVRTITEENKGLGFFNLSIQLRTKILFNLT